MGYISKIKMIIRNPKKIYSSAVKFALICYRSSPGPVLGYISEKITGHNLYLKVLKLLKCDTLRKVQLKDVDNSYIYIDLNDEGICKDLLLYGQREENATKAFKSYLKPGQTIIDIGANIGYYVLIEAAKIQPTGRIYAIEPDPANVKILRKNVKLNHYDNIVDIESAAISNKTGIAKLYLANRSNLHTLTRVPEMDKYVKFKETINVPTFSLDEFIKTKGILAQDIDIIRMDIEGHEIYAIEGMKNILKNSGKLLLFIEVHPKLIKQNNISEYEKFINNLKNYNFEIKECFLSTSSKEDKKIEVQDWKDLLCFNEALELILIKRK